ncbi:MAG: ATP-binding protein [Leptospirales bacterium]
MSKQEVIPSAHRLIYSLRDLGYDFVSAVADLIDNSIEAGANQVVIHTKFNGDNSWVTIEDDGLGMSKSQLVEAMRYGSNRDYDGEKDLGKFGLGLKTASMSQCQKLTVSSQQEEGPISSYCWDLEHIKKTNKWEIIKPDEKEMKLILKEALNKKRGTVVLWQRLDRILGFKKPYGEQARKRLSEMTRELEDHLAMVFHRFLEGAVPDKKLEIVLNGNTVQAWDPFVRSEEKTQALESKKIPLEHEGKSGIINIEPYILPSKDAFSTSKKFSAASGPKKWNQQQGFYIYRANRLIQSGGWSHLRAVDEHTKLARLALSFSPHLDDAFKINVAKKQVQLPTQIRDKIDSIVKPLCTNARKVYDKKVPTPAGSSQTPAVSYQRNSAHLHSSQMNLTMPVVETGSSTGATGFTTDQRLWSLDELEVELEAIADDTEKAVMLNLFAKFRKIIKQ